MSQKLLLPGTSERLSLHGFLLSPTGKRFLLHTESAGGEGGSDRWLCDLESGDLRPVKAGDGVMDAWMIEPRDFDPAKKYPAFVVVDGEPAGQTVLDEWYGGQGHTLFHRAVADLGYIVVSIDNRGTRAPKGAAWRRAVFGSLGPLSTKEQAAGLKALPRLCPFVALSRVAIWGWSGGGLEHAC